MLMMTTEETVRTLVAASPAYRSRLFVALDETRALLAKELAYSPAMQKADRVAFLTGHIATLESYL